MKYFAVIGLAIFSLFAVFGCSKDAENNLKNIKPLDADSVSHSLSGSWELRHLTGCQLPNCNPDFPGGNGTMWKFADSTYQYYTNHQLISEGKFMLGKDTCLATGRLMNYFVLVNAANQYTYLDKLFFELEQGQLVLYRGILTADGTIEKYDPFN